MSANSIKPVVTVVLGVIIAGVILSYAKNLPVLKNAAEAYGG